MSVVRFLELHAVEKYWLNRTKVVRHSADRTCHTKATGDKEVRVLVSWLHSLDPSLSKHLQELGIAPQWVEEKVNEQCCASLAYRHRLTNGDWMETSRPRFHIRIDAEC